MLLLVDNFRIRNPQLNLQKYKDTSLKNRVSVSLQANALAYFLQDHRAGGQGWNYRFIYLFKY